MSDRASPELFDGGARDEVTAAAPMSFATFNRRLRAPSMPGELDEAPAVKSVSLTTRADAMQLRRWVQQKFKLRSLSFSAGAANRIVARLMTIDESQHEAELDAFLAGLHKQSRTPVVACLPVRALACWF